MQKQVDQVEIQADLQLIVLVQVVLLAAILVVEGRLEVRQVHQLVVHQEGQQGLQAVVHQELQAVVHQGLQAAGHQGLQAAVHQVHHIIVIKLKYEKRHHYNRIISITNIVFVFLSSDRIRIKI